MPRVFSTRVYFCFLVAAYIVAEIIECAVFLYLDKTFYSLRTVSQCLYVATLLISACTITVYVYAMLNRGRALKRYFIAIIAVPVVVGILSMLFGSIKYAQNGSGAYYTTGTAIKFCYFVGFLYIIATLLVTFFRRSRLRKEEARSIIAGLLMWAILAFFQFSNHGYQVSSVAMMLMALILFLSSENPMEYYEKHISNVRNREAFHMLLVEWFSSGKSFFITSAIFTGKSGAISGEDRKQLNDLQSKLAELGETEVGEVSYLSSWNTLSMITRKISFPL